MAGRADLLQGTLDLLILKNLRDGPQHGWGLSKRIRHLTSDVLQVNQGSLYPALYRLEAKGLVRSGWQRTDAGRRAKMYRLTPIGERRCEEEGLEWRRFVQAMEQALQGA